MEALATYRFNSVISDALNYLLPDGKLLSVCAYDWGYGLTRFNTNGQVDATFGTNGVTTIYMPSSASTWRATPEGIAVDASGKIYITGWGYSSASNPTDPNLSLIRLTSSGALDTTFGTGGRVFAYSLGIGTSTQQEQGMAVSIQSDGKVLVAGYINNAPIVFRFTSSGAIDTTFGSSNGLFSYVSGTPTLIDQLADGGIRVTSLYIGGTSKTLLAEYFDKNASTSPTRVSVDLTFTPVVTTYQADGKILVAGYSTAPLGDKQFALARYLATPSNGKFVADPNFGTSGLVASNFTTSYDDQALAVSVQSNGKILVAGVSQVNGSKNFTIARYNTNGTIDTTFSSDGYDIRLPFSSTLDKSVTSVLTQTDGKILLSGYVDASTQNNDYYLVTIRYNADGSLDTAYTSNRLPTGTLGIVGTKTQGQILTVSNSIADLDGLGTFTYTWKANGNIVSSSTSGQLTLTQAEVGKTITVTASYTDNFGTTESLTSSATSVVGNINDSVAGSVVISGTPTRNQILTASNNLTDLDGLGLIAYTWKANGANIGTGNSYLLTQSEVGKTITVTASYSDGYGYSESVTSSATSFVGTDNVLPTGSVVISGSVVIGQTLTASNSLADVDGLGAISYAWKANGVSIGTGPTYLLTQSEVGKTITVTASYTDGYGAAESATSSATSAVAGILTTTIQDSVAGVAKSAVDYQVTFSSSVTGLTASDFVVENGSVTSITGSGSSYVVRVTPTVNSYGFIKLSLTAGAVFNASAETNVVQSAEDQYFITSTGTLASTINLGRNLYSNQDWQLVIKQSYGGKDFYLALPNSSSYGFVNNGSLVVSKQIGAYQFSIPDQTELRNLFINYLLTGKSAGWNPPNETKWMATAYYWTSTPVSASGRADFMAVQLGTINDQYNTFGTGQTYDSRSDAMLAYSVSVDTRVSAILKSQQINEQSNNATTLVVFREGVTTRSIYVPLNISGTATYGVDYVLEGDFSVVSGKVFANLGLNISNASITLRALKDTLVESNETVSISIDTSSFDYLSVAQSLSLTILESGPTGAVSIGGVARLGEVLTASNSIADIDGLGAIIYRWSADGVEISGAIGPTFTLVQSQLGKSISVKAYYTDGNGNLESLASAPTAVVQGGAGNDSLTGTLGNDILDGGSGNDILDGGAGADRLIGGAGDDIYYVDNIGDVIVENVSDNTPSQQIFSLGNTNDVVVASVSYTLNADAAVEDLMAGGDLTGNSALNNTSINLIGNELAQGVVGNDASNILSGMAGDDILVGMGGDDTLNGGEGKDGLFGGAGNDTLNGGAGNDFFAFNQGISFGTNLVGQQGWVSLTGGSDVIDGGEGDLNTIYMRGNLEDYYIRKISTTEYAISVNSGSTVFSTETAVFKNIQRLAFGTVEDLDNQSVIKSYLLSSLVIPVAIPNNLPTGSVFISGSAMQGKTLSASNSLADADGLGSISYTWKANGETVGIGTTYLITQSEVGKTITVTANYIDAVGNAESPISAATNAVLVALPQINVSTANASVDEHAISNLVYTFTRTGDLSSSLSVNFLVGGSASKSDYSSSINLLSGNTKAWTRLLGTSSYEFTSALTTGLDGSLYVSGSTYGNLDGNINNGSSDAFITKYLPDGAKSWTKLLGSTSSDSAYFMATGLDGAIYICGVTNGDLDGNKNVDSYDAFISKYQPDGTKSWTKTLGTNTSDYAWAMTVGSDGAIYIGGFTNGSLDNQNYSGGEDAFITKYLADGTKSWTKLLGTTSSDGVYALTTGIDGSLYVGGWTGGNLDGNINNGRYDAFITKYQPNGSKSWTALIGANTPQYVSLTTGLDGSIYVCGSTYENLDGNTNNGNYDIFITKYLPDGTKSWTKLLGTSYEDIARSIKTGLDGSIYVSGYTIGNLDGQINSGGSDYYNMKDAFIAKYQSDGTKLWTKLFGGAYQEDYATALTIGLDGSVYMAGDTKGSLDGQTNSGETDAFIAKYMEASSQITFSAGSSTATLVIDPNADTLVEGSESVVVSIVQGGSYDLGTSPNATGAIFDALRFIGGSNSDTFVGIYNATSKNSFLGLGGNDFITGATRADVAEYSGNLSEYTISYSSAFLTITDNRTTLSNEGIDTLYGINILKFADGMEFVGQVAQKVALTGLEADHLIEVNASKLYCGTNFAEKFVIGSNVSSMILAGDGDTVHLSGSFTDYTYSARGSELQIIKGDFMTTVNLAGDVLIETDIGHGLTASVDFSHATPRVILDTQFVSTLGFDSTLLNNHAVI